MFVFVIAPAVALCVFGVMAVVVFPLALLFTLIAGIKETFSKSP